MKSTSVSHAYSSLLLKSLTIISFTEFRYNLHIALLSSTYSPYLFPLAFKHAKLLHVLIICIQKAPIIFHVS